VIGNYSHGVPLRLKAEMLTQFAEHVNGPVGKLARCAIYTRKSSEHNLDLAFSSLDAQREACEAYIKSQAHEGWRLIPGRYDDGAFSGASLDRPALQQLLADVRAGEAVAGGDQSACLRMQSEANRSRQARLPAIAILQGDFQKWQGEPMRSCQIS
jgi:hypothetical protein